MVDGVVFIGVIEGAGLLDELAAAAAALLAAKADMLLV